MSLLKASAVVRQKLAIDGMGGDRAPSSIIMGIKRVIQNYPNVEFLIFGDEKRIRSALQEHDLNSPSIDIFHTPESIPGDMRPVQALRQSKNSSMRLAIEAVIKGEADAVISSGNTGAYMALSKTIFKTLPGIDRPAIVGLIPTEKGQCVMLDMGANIECTPQMLLQFALMGRAFAAAHQITNPRVGLLNIGEESQKGHAELQEAYQLFTQNKDHLNFKGFVEGNNIFADIVDVVVADGFSGNIAIKSAEGTTKLFSRFMREALSQSLWARVGSIFLLPLVQQIRKRLDPRLYNGAMFIGLNHVAVKSHGGADGLAFHYAILRTLDILKSGTLSQIEQGMKKLDLSHSQDVVPMA